MENLIFSCMHETLLSPFGSPLIINETIVDWGALIFVWRLVALGWIIVGIALFLLTQFKKT